MSILTVGPGQQFSTIAAAVASALSGDTVNVQAGTYTDDFVSLYKSLTLNAVGGTVTMKATTQPPNGKAILTAGAPGTTINVNGFSFTGASVRDGNGAGIRYEGGTLNVTNSSFFNNQNGILGNSDPAGAINISRSEFGFNGTGDGYTHNIYVNTLAQFTLTESYIHDANLGHEVKSRALNNTITNNRIFDNNSTASYQIDLPVAGNAEISGNTIQQGPNSQNPTIIAYGEEGASNPGRSLVIANNTIVNDRSSARILWNTTNANAQFTDNAIVGFGNNALVTGPSSQSGTTVLTSRPALVQAVPSPTATTPPVAVAPPVTAPIVTPPFVAPTPVAPTPPAVGANGAAAVGSGLVIGIAEDAYRGDAQYLVLADGQQIGGVRTATASHSEGRSEQVSLGTLSAGAHAISVQFINDLYGGSGLDRNLYVTDVTYDGVKQAVTTAGLYSAETRTFAVAVPAVTAAAPIAAVAAPTPEPTPAPPVVVPPAAPAPLPSADDGSGLVIGIAEDQYSGHAQYLVLVDDRQIGAIRSASASHSAGQSEQVSIGALTAGLHQVAVRFVNDAYGGQGLDRNLYVTGLAYGGVSPARSTASLFSDGSATFELTVAGSAPAPVATPTSTLQLSMSEDAYRGDAQFTVYVDGRQLGGIHTATASHAAGQSQAFTFTDIAETFAPHVIAVQFLNDVYGGAAGDRNLYVDQVQVNGRTIPGSTAALYSEGVQRFVSEALPRPAG